MCFKNLAIVTYDCALSVNFIIKKVIFKWRTKMPVNFLFLFTNCITHIISKCQWPLSFALLCIQYHCNLHLIRILLNLNVKAWFGYLYGIPLLDCWSSQGNNWNFSHSSLTPQGPLNQHNICYEVPLLNHSNIFDVSVDCYLCLTCMTYQCLPQSEDSKNSQWFCTFLDNSSISSFLSILNFIKVHVLKKSRVKAWFVTFVLLAWHNFFFVSARK